MKVVSIKRKALNFTDYVYHFVEFSWFILLFDILYPYLSRKIAETKRIVSISEPRFVWFAEV